MRRQAAHAANSAALQSEDAPLGTSEFEVLAGLMRARRSCRDFLQKPVAEETIGQLFETAQLAASWCNTQPWQVVLASGAAAREFGTAYRAEVQRSDACPDFPFPTYDGIYQERRRDCGLQLYASLGIERGDRAASREQAEKNYEFFGAPHIAIITTDDRLGTYGAVDCGGYVATLLCLAQALGLGAIAQGPWRRTRNSCGATSSSMTRAGSCVDLRSATAIRPVPSISSEPVGRRRRKSYATGIPDWLDPACKKPRRLHEPTSYPCAPLPAETRRCGSAGSSGATAFSQAVAKADWPVRPIHLVIGFPAGQATDRTARIVADQLATRIGQPVIVENRPGQAGSIALAMLKRAPADGYTMGLMATASLVTNPHLYKSVGYDSLTDFAPVSVLGSGPLLLVAHAGAPFSTVDGLVQYAKAHPGKLSYCSTGNGTLSHLAMEEFKRRAGISMVHVPYQGSVQAMMDLSGSVVSVCFDTISGTQPSLNAGRIKVMAVASSKRMALFPDLPTIAESGFPGFEAAPYIGLLFPATTPASIVERVASELQKIKALPEVREYMASTGTVLVFGSPAEFSAQLREDYAKWRSVIQESGIQLN